ncbi:BURP domain protein RD22-like [Chenopodium quinoa]|uniref:BURP domain protein RD22-like n=1 Tax=Chenopodium quinoa TaxID=63459 RepID=UPI000B771F84|nr:BURP domain protein RD22-like [Chenopodium quinoa]
MSTESKTIDDKVQKYTITAVKKVANDNEAAVCHKQKYAYAVFYCHKTKDTSAYTVSLMGADGSKAKAMAVCHKDTSAWNPKHLAFQALNVKPGSVPIGVVLSQASLPSEIYWKKMLPNTEMPKAVKLSLSEPGICSSILKRL